MTPPISIDGTDITGATIDGTDVQEITVDGQTVFSAAVPIPQSVINNRFGHYIVSNLSLNNNDPVTTLPDEEQSNNFSTTSGTIIFKTNGPNSFPFIQLDSTSDEMEATLGQTLSPFTVVTVSVNDILAPAGQRGLYFQSSSGGHIGPRENERGGGGQIIYAGPNQFINGPPTDSQFHINTYVQNGAASVIRQDGSQIASGNPGTRGFGSTVTMELDGGGQGGYAEIIVFNGDFNNTQTLSDTENYLSQKFGISI